MNIQPSSGRLNVNDLLGSEIEEASSTSEAKLFSRFSPENRISVAPVAPIPHRNPMNAVRIFNSAIHVINFGDSQDQPNTFLRLFRSHNNSPT